MSKYHVGTVDDGQFSVPEVYASHSEGYRRLELIDATTSPSCVHSVLGIAEISPGGFHEPVIHAFEKAFYVLEGEVILNFHGRAHRLSQGYYGLIHKAAEYTLYNPGDEPARLLDINAPQPKPSTHTFQDTVFQPGEVVKTAEVPDLDDPRIKYIGYFDEAGFATGGGDISGVGVRSASIKGIAIDEWVDRMFGSYHVAMFLVQFFPGGTGTTHDHPLEETYFILSGKARVTLDGESFLIGPGNVVWTGVGCFHQFECLGDEPVRWIETQAPLPADYETFRFRREWDPLSA
jgi:mannose-6-phosphate isomerase-like protein (cupin superfamily)